MPNLCQVHNHPDRALDARIALGLPLVEDKKDGQRDAPETRRVVPSNLFAEIENRKNGEDRERDDLLNGLQLRGREFVRADTIGGDLEAILEESDSPTDENNLPERRGAIFEVTVPGKGHKDIGDGQQKNGSHRCWILSQAWLPSAASCRGALPCVLPEMDGSYRV